MNVYFDAWRKFGLFTWFGSPVVKETKVRAHNFIFGCLLGYRCEATH